MSDVIVDVFHDRPAGAVLVGRLYAHRRRGTESATFAYDESWLRARDAFELEPGLPLVGGSQQTPVGRGVFGVFTDSAPDRWGQRLITRREKRRAELSGSAPRSFGPVDFLLGVRDDVRQGALRYRLPDTEDFLQVESEGVPQLLELGQLLGSADRLEREMADDDDLRVLVRAGSSLGGARPKAHVLDTQGRLSIAKFPSPSTDEWEVMAWEHVTLELAGRCGIRVPASRLHDVAGTQVLILDRFDRDGEIRIDYASAMTMLEATDGKRRTYLELAEVIETISEQPVLDLAELWRRIAFSILVSNTDDHLRNHAFLRPAGRPGWQLSPAFDLNPNPIDRGELSTSIATDDHAADIRLLLEVADWFRLDAAAARRVLGEVERGTRDWRSVARRVGAPAREIDFMSSAFDHEQRALARAATGS